MLVAKLAACLALVAVATSAMVGSPDVEVALSAGYSTTGGVNASAFRQYRCGPHGRVCGGDGRCVPFLTLAGWGSHTRQRLRWRTGPLPFPRRAAAFARHIMGCGAVWGLAPPLPHGRTPTGCVGVCMRHPPCLPRPCFRNGWAAPAVGVVALLLRAQPAVEFSFSFSHCLLCFWSRGLGEGGRGTALSLREEAVYPTPVAPA
jgi:hypothetical protein